MKSYTALNQKFYGIRLFDTPEDFGLLPPFFYEYVNMPTLPTLSTELKEVKQFAEPIETGWDISASDKEVIAEPSIVVDHCSFKTPISEAVMNGGNERVEKSKWFDPKQKDTLFWCIFVAVFGLSEYMLIGTKYANREWEEKQAAILEFQKSSAELRATNHKITLGKVQEIMSEYMTNQSQISFMGVVGLAVYYKIQIYLVDSVKKTHLVYTPENYTQTCYIYWHNTFRNKFRLALEPVSLDDSFCLESYIRPLRAISTYKIGELVHLAERFGILYDAKPKKEELYRKISEYATIQN